MREQLETEQSQVALERTAVATQRDVIASLESQLSDLQFVKAGLEARLAQAGEEAAEAKLTIAGMSQGQKELQRETTALRERLEAVRQVTRDQALGEAQLRVDEAMEQLRLALEESEAARKQVGTAASALMWLPASYRPLLSMGRGALLFCICFSSTAACSTHP